MVYDMNNTTANYNLNGNGGKAKKENIFSRHPFLSSGILFGLFALYFIISGAYNLIKMQDTVTLDEFWKETSHTNGEAVTGTVHFGTSSYLSIDHSINFIPTGTEYYYLIFNDDYTKCITIRAKNKWDAVLDHNGYSEEGIQIKGRLVELDHDVKQQLGSLYSFFQELGVTANSAYYIDDMLPLISWLSIAAGVLLLLLMGFFGFVISNKMNSFKTTRDKVWYGLGVVLLLIDFGLMLYVFSFR